jgi:hypothetical protein
MLAMSVVLYSQSTIQRSKPIIVSRAKKSDARPTRMGTTLSHVGCFPTQGVGHFGRRHPKDDGGEPSPLLRGDFSLGSRLRVQNLSLHVSLAMMLSIRLRIIFS